MAWRRRREGAYGHGMVDAYTVAGGAGGDQQAAVVPGGGYRLGHAGEGALPLRAAGVPS